MQYRLLAAMVLLSACNLRSGNPAEDGVPVHRDYQAPESTARITWSDVSGYDGSAADFLVRGGGDTLVLLDGRAAEIATLLAVPATGSDRATIWRLAGRFGRAGDGPGEFRRPAGIASAADGSIWVWGEAGRLQRFTTDGSLLGEGNVRLPCALFRSTIAATGEALFLGGQCASGGATRDTVHARAYRVVGSELTDELVRAPVATTDLRFGSIFTAQRFVSEGLDGVIFATGLDGCLTTIPAAAGQANAADGSSPSTECRAPPARYRSKPPEFLKQVAMPNGARPRWPDPISPLFAYVDGAVPHIVQMTSADSLVVTPWLQGESPVLAAPANSFVGCRGEYCLWFEAAASRLALVRFGAGDDKP